VLSYTDISVALLGQRDAAAGPICRSAATRYFLAGARPDVWVADRYAGQNNHGMLRQQLCRAHYADLLIMPTGAWEPALAAVIAATGSA